ARSPSPLSPIAPWHCGPTRAIPILDPRCRQRTNASIRPARTARSCLPRLPAHFDCPSSRRKASHREKLHHMTTESVPKWRRLEPDERKEQIFAMSARILTSCGAVDRKSTRMNSSHVKISYTVFRLEKT